MSFTLYWILRGFIVILFQLSVTYIIDKILWLCFKTTYTIYYNMNRMTSCDIETTITFSSLNLFHFIIIKLGPITLTMYFFYTVKQVISKCQMSNVNVMEATAFSQYTEVCPKYSTINACSITLRYFFLDVNDLMHPWGYSKNNEQICK